MNAKVALAVKILDVLIRLSAWIFMILALLFLVVFILFAQPGGLL